MPRRPGSLTFWQFWGATCRCVGSTRRSHICVPTVRDTRALDTTVTHQYHAFVNSTTSLTCATLEAMMPKPLTSLERRILDYLVEYLRKNTYQPSIREIGKRFGIKSTKTVSEYLQALADKGWVERDPSRSRGVRLIGVEVNTETVSVPRVAAPVNGNGEIV